MSATIIPLRDAENVETPARLRSPLHARFPASATGAARRWWRRARFDRRSARLDHRRRFDHCGGKGMTNEFFYRRGDKRRDEALHEPILDNPAADEAISRQAIERAMRRGLTREQAERLYR